MNQINSNNSNNNNNNQLNNSTSTTPSVLLKSPLTKSSNSTTTTTFNTTTYFPNNVRSNTTTVVNNNNNNNNNSLERVSEGGTALYHFLTSITEISDLYHLDACYQRPVTDALKTIITKYNIVDSNIYWEFCNKRRIPAFPITGYIVAIFLGTLPKKDRKYFLTLLESIRKVTSPIFSNTSLINLPSPDWTQEDRHLWKNYIDAAQANLFDWPIIQELLPDFVPPIPLPSNTPNYSTPPIASTSNSPYQTAHSNSNPNSNSNQSIQNFPPPGFTSSNPTTQGYQGNNYTNRNDKGKGREMPRSVERKQNRIPVPTPVVLNSPSTSNSTSTQTHNQTTAAVEYQAKLSKAQAKFKIRHEALAIAAEDNGWNGTFEERIEECQLMRSIWGFEDLLEQYDEQLLVNKKLKLLQEEEEASRKQNRNGGGFRDLTVHEETFDNNAIIARAQKGIVVNARAALHLAKALNSSSLSHSNSNLPFGDYTPKAHFINWTPNIIIPTSDLISVSTCFKTKPTTTSIPCHFVLPIQSKNKLSSTKPGINKSTLPPSTTITKIIQSSNIRLPKRINSTPPTTQILTSTSISMPTVSASTSNQSTTSLTLTHNPSIFPTPPVFVSLKPSPPSAPPITSSTPSIVAALQPNMNQTVTNSTTTTTTTSSSIPSPSPLIPSLNSKESLVQIIQSSSTLIPTLDLIIKEHEMNVDASLKEKELILVEKNLIAEIQKKKEKEKEIEEGELIEKIVSPTIATKLIAISPPRPSYPSPPRPPPSILPPPSSSLPKKPTPSIPSTFNSIPKFIPPVSFQPISRTLSTVVIPSVLPPPPAPSSPPKKKFKSSKVSMVTNDTSPKKLESQILVGNQSALPVKIVAAVEEEVVAVVAEAVVSKDSVVEAVSPIVEPETSSTSEVTKSQEKEITESILPVEKEKSIPTKLTTPTSLTIATPIISSSIPTPTSSGIAVPSSIATVNNSSPVKSISQSNTLDTSPFNFLTSLPSFKRASMTSIPINVASSSTPTISPISTTAIAATKLAETVPLINSTNNHHSNEIVKKGKGKEKEKEKEKVIEKKRERSFSPPPKSILNKWRTDGNLASTPVKPFGEVVVKKKQKKN